MRLILFTGKGGVGKTTCAAGTAALAARAGHKTLVVSTDAAHSLADAFGVHAPHDGLVEVEAGLHLHQVDYQGSFERSWADIQRYLVSLLDRAGADPIEAEELAVLPGAEEVLALLDVRDHVRSGRWDVVVVDCAPTGETLRLLALPEALGWYARRLLPASRGLTRALRPAVGRAGVPLPPTGVLAAVERLGAQMADVRAMLTRPETSVRLVLTPESVVVAETRRTLTSLALYGYRVDAVLANRLVPGEGADPWRAGWAEAQARALVDVESSFAPLPVLRAPFQAAEPVGADALADLAGHLYAGRDALAPPEGDEPLSVERSAHEFVLSLALPLAERSETRLGRHGDDLVVTVGDHRRVINLPSALRRCTVVGARMVDGRLRIRFEPDPSLWRDL